MVTLAMMTPPALLGTAAASALPAGQVLIGGFDVGPGGLPGKFDPLTATAGFTWYNTYFETLVLYNPGFTHFVGALAKNWTTAQGGRSYTFHLRPGVLWQDGEPLTAQDVKFTLELASNPATGSIFSGRLSDLQSISVVGKDTVTVRFSRPDVNFLDLLTKLMILPQHLLASIPPSQLAQSNWWYTHPIGTGPFQFVKYVPGQYVQLKAFPEYWGGKPKLSGLVNRYFKTVASAAEALKAGSIQFTYVNPDNVSTFAHDPKFRVIAGPSYVVNYLGFNARAPMFKSRLVREAFMYAIDRKQIVDSLYGGAATLADCPYVAPALLGSSLNSYPYDPTKAKELLAQAGWSQLNGSKPIPVLTYYDDQLTANVLSAMQAMLAQVGIDIAPRQVDVATYNSIILASHPDWRKFPIVFAGLQDGPDPSSVAVGLSANNFPPRGANFLHVNIPELTKLFTEAGSTTALSAQTHLYRQVCAEVNRQLPWAPMWVATRYGVVSTSVKNFVWTPSPGGGAYAAMPQDWSLSR